MIERYLTVRFVERDIWLKVPFESDDKRTVKFYLSEIATAIATSYADEMLREQILDAKVYGIFSVTHKYWLENDRFFVDYKIKPSVSADTLLIDGDILEIQNRQNFVNTSSLIHYAEGYLYKKGERSFTWRKRYFILRNYMLFFYAEKGDKTPKGQIDMTQEFSFKQVNGTETAEKTNNIEFHLITQSKVYRLMSDNLPDMRNWIRIVKSIRSRLHERLNIHGSVKSDDLSTDDDDTLSSEEIEPYIKSPIEYSRSVPGCSGSLLPTFGHLRLTDAVHRRSGSNNDSTPLLETDILGTSTPVHADIHGDKIGYLYKKGHFNKILRYRLFVLRDKILYYYKLIDKSEGGVEDLTLNNTKYFQYAGMINLEGVRIFSDNKDGKKSYIFRIVAPSRAYLLCTSDKEEFDDWKDAFEFISGVCVEDMSAADLKLDDWDVPDPDKPYKAKLKLDFEKYGSPDFEGYLLKQGNDRLGKWRKRWCILLGRTLFYCKERGVEPLGSIPLSISRVEANETELSLNISVRNTDISLPSLRVFHLKALDVISFKSWKDQLELFALAK